MAPYEAIVDMGSNGIRFSITDIAPHTARCLPTVFSERLGVSLYDAQWAAGERVPIPRDVMQQVARAFRRFKAACRDFGVDEEHIRVLATEATRTAPNSADFMQELHAATGWTVGLLSKEDEGLMGAFGIASSFDQVRGLCMDLGGGSTQLSWIYTQDGDVRTSKGAVSLPYGAAALTKNPPNKKDMVANLSAAYGSLDLPPELQSCLPATEGGINLYLSGGGFRGWGFALMDQHPTAKPYPIPIINGFCVPARIFRDTDAIVSAIEGASKRQEPLTMHRVSKRRAAQIPAVAKLVGCVTEALPCTIKDVYFCQGGVREGRLFSELPAPLRCEHPLVAATRSFACRSAPALAAMLHRVAHMSSGAPGCLLHKQDPHQPGPFHLALASILHRHCSLPKDVRAAAALHCTVTGDLAGAHGLSHRDRAHLAISLCERHGGRKDLDPANAQQYDRLLSIVEEPDRWWLRYLGRVAGLVAAVYPAGIPSAESRNGDASSSERISFVEDASGEADKVALTVKVADDFFTDSFEDALKCVQKLGKKKHWMPGEVGRKVDWKAVKC